LKKDELMPELEKLKAADINAEEGKIFAYVYTGEGDNFEMQQAAHEFFTGWVAN
jgi:hypothetical protein